MGLSSDDRLLGKTIVITGAARGIGASYANLVARLGANVVVADIDKSALDEFAAGVDNPSRFRTLQADVAERGEVDALVQLAVDTFGGLDGFVNNAVAPQSMGDIGEIEPSAIRRNLETNLLGPILGTESAAQVMKVAGHGSIVNVTSGAQCGMAKMGIYGAAKGAVASYTYCAAIDLAPFGIRVNAISPMAATRMVDTNAAYRSSHGMPTHHVVLPGPDNNAAAVAFLLSDQSAEVTGQVIRVDIDGISIMSHPGRIDASLVRGNNWTFDDVITAFDETLSKHLFENGHRVSVI